MMAKEFVGENFGDLSTIHQGFIPSRLSAMWYDQLREYMSHCIPYNGKFLQMDKLTNPYFNRFNDLKC